MRLFAILMLVVAAVGVSVETIRAAASTEPSTQPTVKVPACCGEECKKMSGCCTVDDKGKVTCSMGGNCCVKSDKKEEKMDGMK